MSDAISITDPAGALLGLAALCSLLAAWLWLKVATSIDGTGQTVIGPDPRRLSRAAVLTAVAMGLAGAGYLIGRFSGSF